MSHIAAHMDALVRALASQRISYALLGYAIGASTYQKWLMRRYWHAENERVEKPARKSETATAAAAAEPRCSDAPRVCSKSELFRKFCECRKR
jgi:hypothetical protein